MPGRGVFIPCRCVDANGRERPLFNPAIRGNVPPEGFDAIEWRTITARLQKQRLNQSSTAGLLGVGVTFSLFGLCIVQSGAVSWWWSLLGFIPPFGAVIAYCLLRLLAQHTWGVVAFVEVSADQVVHALL